jgi:hypothetical protein
LSDNRINVIQPGSVPHTAILATDVTRLPEGWDQYATIQRFIASSKPEEVHRKIYKVLQMPERIIKPIQKWES